MEEGEKEYMLQIQHICKEYRTAVLSDHRARQQEHQRYDKSNACIHLSAFQPVIKKQYRNRQTCYADHHDVI